MNWLKYSGATLSFTLNPYHWTIQCKYRKSADVWEQDDFVLQLGPLSVRVWIDDGNW